MDESASAGTNAVGIVDRRTGLASDYTNHLAGVSMLIELLPAMPELADDVLAWQPMSYEDYFRSSPLSTAMDALQAFAAVPDDTKRTLEVIVACVEERVGRVQRALESGTPEKVADVAAQVSPDLTVLLVDLATLVNGGQPSMDAAAA